MQTFGTAPYLECSSRGEKRFSAFYARIKCMGNRTIEEIYQSAKEFPEGTRNYDWRTGKGRVALNQKQVRKLYTRLWRIYISENPELVRILLSCSGLSDIYGQHNHACQAEELWNIRTRLLQVKDIEEWIARRLK